MGEIFLVANYIKMFIKNQSNVIKIAFLALNKEKQQLNKKETKKCFKNVYRLTIIFYQFD